MKKVKIYYEAEDGSSGEFITSQKAIDEHGTKKLVEINTALNKQ